MRASWEDNSDQEHTRGRYEVPAKSFDRVSTGGQDADESFREFQVEWKFFGGLQLREDVEPGRPE